MEASITETAAAPGWTSATHTNLIYGFFISALTMPTALRCYVLLRRDFHIIRKVYKREANAQQLERAKKIAQKRPIAVSWTAYWQRRKGKLDEYRQLKELMKDPGVDTKTEQDIEAAHVNYPYHVLPFTGWTRPAKIQARAPTLESAEQLDPETLRSLRCEEDPNAPSVNNVSDWKRIENHAKHGYYG
ncbi:MAG: hypothetical protein Q9162_001145 [Coniocarpon cinnabarinum]